MKTLLPFSFALALAATGTSHAQQAFSKPSGYVTQKLKENSLNNIGLSLHSPVLINGEFSVVNGAIVTVGGSVNLTTVLPANKMCILEVNSGVAKGTVQEFSTWTSTTITLPAAIAGLAASDDFSVRVAPTIQELFPVGLLTGGFLPTNADKIWVPNSPGSYTRYWYKSVGADIGWHTTTTGVDDTGLVNGDIPVIYIDGLIVEKKAGEKDFVITGEVKTSSSNILVAPGFNQVGITPPAGLTLFTSGLQSDVTGGFLPTNADIVWVPNSSGSGFTKYWYKSVGGDIGWHTTSTGIDDTGLVAIDPPLVSAVKIQRKGATSKVLKLAVPASYSGL